MTLPVNNFDTPEPWYDKGSNIVDLDNLLSDGVAVVTATVTCNLYDEDGNALTNGSNIALVKIADGHWKKEILVGAGVVTGPIGSKVLVEVLADIGGGTIMPFYEWREVVRNYA